MKPLFVSKSFYKKYDKPIVIYLKKKSVQRAKKIGVGYYIKMSISHVQTCKYPYVHACTHFMLPCIIIIGVLAGTHLTNTPDCRPSHTKAT